jgi:predicted dehydrogenase
MLESEKLDGVSVCTPNYAHADPTIAALNAGVNVLCEKPIAITSMDAQLMVDAARKTGKMLTIGHHMRFLPMSLFLRKIIADGELGQIYYGRSHALRRRLIPGWGQFHIKSKSGGGPLIDVGVHALDLIVWLMGSPTATTVSGAVYRKFGHRPDFYNPYGTYPPEEYDVEDFATAFVRFDNGSSLNLEASWATHLKETESFPQIILGDQGGAEFNPYSKPPAPTPLRILKSRHEALLDIIPSGLPDLEPHAEEIKHWVSCLRGENEILVKAEESLNIQRILDAIYLSSESAKEIRITEMVSQESNQDKNAN